MRRVAPRRWWTVALAAFLVAGTGLAFAQRWGRFRNYDPRNGVPNWKTDRHHPTDTFTFTRIRYGSWRNGRAWATDYPSSDLNLSYRLQQLTSMNVDPDGRIVELDENTLFDYPFIYISEPGGMLLSDGEVTNLRRYLLNGGFLMVDDFWGEREWFGFYEQIKRVFPDREPVELDATHPIFHQVFDLDEKPQIPALHDWLWSGSTSERYDSDTPHFRALFDDYGRMMAIICHNTDLGDGWEREGEDARYFKLFSEAKAYPMGINILFYALTH